MNKKLENIKNLNINYLVKMLIKIKKPENLKKTYTKEKTIKAQKQKGGA